MGTNDDVNIAIFQFLQSFLNLLGALETIDIFNRAWHARQTLGKGGIMLQSQHRGRHQNSHLFAVGHCFERRADSDFRLAKAHIPTYQTVHRMTAFHIVFHLVQRLHLVGCVLVYKRSLQLILQVAVGRECEAVFGLSLGIQLNQIYSQLFHPLLGPFFYPFPSAGT